jgi:hypothetical protein
MISLVSAARCLAFRMRYPGPFEGERSCARENAVLQEAIRKLNRRIDELQAELAQDTLATEMTLGQREF